MFFSKVEGGEESCQWSSANHDNGYRRIIDIPWDMVNAITCGTASASELSKRWLPNQVYTSFFSLLLNLSPFSPRSTSISTTAMVAQRHDDDKTPTRDDKRWTGLAFASRLGVYFPIPFFFTNFFFWLDYGYVYRTMSITTRNGHHLKRNGDN